MSSSETEELYNKISKMLSECHHAEMWAELRSRYSHEHGETREVTEARRRAAALWWTAKELYYSNKDSLDRYNDTKESGLNDCFLGMRRVVENEMTELLENNLTDLIPETND